MKTNNIKNPSKRIWLKTPKGRKCILGLVFLIPFFAVMIVFAYIPLAQLIIQSFFQYQVTDLPGRFVGLSNYKAVLTSSLLFKYFKNTVVLYIYLLLFSFIVPIFQAIMLFQLKKTRGFARYMYIFPTGITALAGLSIWKYIWDPESGFANFITSKLGLGTYQWLYSESLVKFCLRFPGILGGGLMVIIYLVTMNNIPKDQFEAAKIDGANDWKVIRYITWPGLKNMVFLQLLLSLSASLLSFEDVYMMTKGGPGFSSTTLVLGAYNKAFRETNFGQAMAMSVIILIFTLIVTSIVNYLKTRNED